MKALGGFLAVYLPLAEHEAFLAHAEGKLWGSFGLNFEFPNLHTDPSAKG